MNQSEATSQVSRNTWASYRQAAQNSSPDQAALQASSSKKPGPRAGRGTWSKPSFQDLRFGFEVTMYIFHR